MLTIINDYIEEDQVKKYISIESVISREEAEKAINELLVSVEDS
jgi:hypothetical protein